MTSIKDKHSKEIAPGQTLRRVVDGKAADAGHEYTVVRYDFKTGGEGADLVADGGFVKELLYPERALEFVVIKDAEKLP